MKLQEIIQKVISQFSCSVLGEKRFFYLLADYHAFDDYPAMKQVMKDLVFYGYGKGLYDRSLRQNKSDYLVFTYDVKKFLALSKHYKKEFADYAVDTISFALGRKTSLPEPSDHGFEPVAGKRDDSPEIVETKYCVVLGTLYKLGINGVEKNFTEAAKQYLRAAELGDAVSQTNLGYMYRYGKGVSRDYTLNSANTTLFSVF